MRILAFALLGLTGCCLFSGRELPVVWTVDEVQIRLNWEPTPGDLRVDQAEALCRAMNVMLYDMLDGQAYIKKFVLSKKSQLPDDQAGVGYLYLPEQQCPT